MALPNRAAAAFNAISQPRGQKLVALAANDPDLARRIEDAVRAFEVDGDQRGLLKLLSDTTGMTDPPPASSYDAPAPRSATRDPMSFENRATRDPNINAAVSELGMGADTPLPFKLDAYADTAAADGVENLIKEIGRSAPRPQYMYDLLPDTSMQFQISDLTPSQMADMNPPRAPQPDLMDAFRGDFERQGDRLASEMGSLSDDIAPPAPPPARVSGGERLLAWIRAVDASRARSAAPQPSRVVDDGEMPPRLARGPDGQRPPISDNARTAAKVAGIGAIGAAANLGMQGIVDDIPDWARDPIGAMRGSSPDGLAPVPNITRPPRAFSTADLAAETSPPPQIMTQEPAPIRPREQAQELMRDLNLRRREAGGEIPEAPAMMREIDRLMSMSNQTMAAASRGEVATGGNDPHMQAARLMAQRNEMLRRGMPTQQAQQMMAEITRLQRLGDEQRNARQAPRRAG